MSVPTGYDWFTAFPDAVNITRTCGGPNTRENFATLGLTIAHQIYALGKEFLGILPRRQSWIAGIGTGRVAIPLKRLLFSGARVIGVDVDSVNVEWCRSTFRDIENSVSDFFPPLELATASIDMVYGISVMTHLTEGAQYAWLKELRRVLKPDGVCVLTTHGEYALIRTGVFRRRLAMHQVNSIGISDLIQDPNLGPQLEMKNYYRAVFSGRETSKGPMVKFYEGNCVLSGRA